MRDNGGGVIGIEDHGPLLDGGMVFVPEFGYADKNGQWVIEHDPQLERAIEELLEVLSKTPGGPPPRPAPPVKAEAP